jgi:hypothetical protein
MGPRRRRGNGDFSVKRLSLAVALFAALIASCAASSAAQAKTFVGVLWPMFGPLPAIGLVELTAEIRMMPNVEVHTYLHQEWPDLVKDMSQLPEGTRTIVIGYSLGANATSWVVNKSKYVDLVIALQPSMLSWNPTITGRAGRIVEVYNPTVWQTFGGMGSKKLEWTAGKIEYMPNNDSHPGAQFNPEFRSMVKTEIARMSAEPDVQTAQAASPSPVRMAYAEQPQDRRMKDIAQILQKDVDAKTQKTVPVRTPASDPATTASLQSISAQMAQEPIPMPARRPQLQAQPQAQPVRLASAGADFPLHQPSQPRDPSAFLDTLSGSVDSGNLAASRELTLADMVTYARRKYAAAHKSDRLNRKEAPLVGGDIIVASNIDPHISEPVGGGTFVKAEGGVD